MADWARIKGVFVQKTNIFPKLKVLFRKRCREIPQNIGSFDGKGGML